MPNNVYVLREIFHDHPEIVGTLESLVRDALLHPEEEVRKYSLGQLNVTFNGLMVAGYMRILGRGWMCE